MYRVKLKEENLSIFASNYLTPRECIGVENTPCPSAICGFQQPCRAQCRLVRVLPFCNTARRCARSFTVGQLAEEGSDKVCTASCFVQHCVVISNQGNTACPWCWKPVLLHRSETSRSILVELCSTSVAGSWFCSLFFFFFFLFFSASRFLMWYD